MSADPPPNIGAQVLLKDTDDDDYLRAECDHLLQTSGRDSDSEHEQPAESGGLLGEESGEEDEDELLLHSRQTLSEAALKSRMRRAFFVRTLALLCACSLSVGSHYATNILGPLKSRLQREMGTSHTQFGLLLSAFSLNSTWTPLVGGILASRLGTTFTSILATGVILLGQIFLLCGDIWEDIRLMTLGLFIFGLGVSPLAVVQETIIVRFFKSHGLGVSMAFGLIAGKGASFVAARTSYPLTERFGPRAPFYVATSLASLSVIINLLYISLSKWLIDGAGAELEAPDINDEARRRVAINLTEAQALEKVAQKRKVHLRQITKLGDVFWAYMGLNLFCGMIWSPFDHLAANIIEHRYHMKEDDAANSAAYLLAGPIVLYPLCGFLVDYKKHRPIVIQLMLLSSSLTMFAYIWFALSPAWTKTPVPAIFSFAVGHGFSPLLLVVLVPKIVPSKYISTALGAHKSMEQTGSTLFQTLSGLLLDSKKPGEKPNETTFQYLLNTFVTLNVLQFGTILLLVLLQYHRLKRSHSRRSSFGGSEVRTSQIARRSEETPLLTGCHSQYLSSGTLDATIAEFRPDNHKRRSEIRRGVFMAVLCTTLVVSAWISFMLTAWYKLGQKRGEH
ncbi:MFS general substrate transporter [Pholiota conissans]|uniref:Lysosomal dipeptide transporter MFSD1 n=1 Tax=Pholiota conissans TaxID=109636 RepID=A0A9P5Z4K4_9AGAR|nr:MFS general substrate transporter [Pholiota conissans]